MRRFGWPKVREKLVGTFPGHLEIQGVGAQVDLIAPHDRAALFDSRSLERAGQATHDLDRAAKAREVA